MSAADALTWAPDCPPWCESTDGHQSDLSDEVQRAMETAGRFAEDPADMDRIIEGTEVGIFHALTFGEGSRWSVRLEACHLYGGACGPAEADILIDIDSPTVEEVQGIALAAQRLAEAMGQMVGQSA